MKFSYGAISKNVEHKSGASWRLVSMKDFDDLCWYLQGRIKRTRQAKSNTTKGWPSFSSFEEFKQKKGR